MSETFYKFIVGIGSNPIFIADISGIILYFNKHAAEVLNIKEENELLFDLIDDDTIAVIRKAINKVNQTEEIFVTNIELTNSEKKSFVCDLKIYKLADNEFGSVYVYELVPEFAITSVRNVNYTVLTSKDEYHLSNSELLFAINYVKNSYKLGQFLPSDIYREIDKSPECIWIKDLTGKFLFVNTAFTHMYHVDSQWLVGKHESVIWKDDTLEQLVSGADIVIKNTHCSIAISGLTNNLNNGEIIEKVFVQTPIIDISNKVVAILGYTSDVVNNEHPNSRTIKSIDSSVSKNFMKMTGDFVFVVDNYGFIKDVSKSYLDRLILKKENIINTSFITHVDISNREFITKVFKNEIEPLTLTGVTLSFKEDDKIETLLSFFKETEDSGSEEYVFICKSVLPTVDITNNDVKSTPVVDLEFLGNVLHDINTPITSILGFSQDLYESIKNPSEDQKESNNIIAFNSKFLRSTLYTFAEFISLMENNGSLNTTAFRFVDMLPSIESEITSLLYERKQELNFAKISSTVEIISDKEKLTSLINYFIAISLKITKSTSIFISAYPYSEDKLYISIKDDFLKISSEFYNNLVQIFIEKNDTLRRNSSISKLRFTLLPKLLEALKGEFFASEISNNVVEFGFLIPLNVNQQGIDANSTNRIPNKSKNNINEINKSKTFENPESIEFNHLSKHKESKIVRNKIPEEFLSLGEKNTTENNVSIRDFTDLSCIYVEDQVDSQILFKGQFNGMKKIDFATSFEDALPMIKSYNYDFIVLDINLEGEYNGIDAMRIIRKTPGYENCLIIGATAFMMPGDKERFLKAGFNNFMPKPVLREKLYPVLESNFGI